MIVSINFATFDLLLLLFFIIFFPRFQFDFMEAEYLIHFPTLALLFKKPSGSERVQECVHALED